MFLNWKLEVRLQVVNPELFLEFVPHPNPTYSTCGTVTFRGIYNKIEYSALKSLLNQ